MPAGVWHDTKTVAERRRSNDVARGRGKRIIYVEDSRDE
jgi:hypothetical protein